MLEVIKGALLVKKLTTIAITTPIDKGLDFILSHFHEPLWPRTISTKPTEGRQTLVYSKEEAISYFNGANYLDCKISAYPHWKPTIVSNFLGIKNAIRPNLIMIDLDICNFEFNDKMLAQTLQRILKRIKEILLGLKPTIIWSGNGYHIYIPIDVPIILEDVKEFSNIERVSTKFLRFAEWYLSNGKSDPAHNKSVSVNNCMLRIPGSYNSKEQCVNPEVRLIQQWKNDYRPSINLLLGTFLAYLKDQKIKELELQQYGNNNSSHNNTIVDNNYIPWIEKLLQTPIQDCRKLAVWRILAPYLLNVRRLSEEQVYSIIKDWLEKCNRINRLDFNVNLRIKDGLRGARKGYFPIGGDNSDSELVRNEMYTWMDKQ